MHDYEHMTIHKVRERELIESAERMRYFRRQDLIPGRLRGALRSHLFHVRSQTAKRLRALANALDSYRAGCVDGPLTCE